MGWRGVSRLLIFPPAISRESLAPCAAAAMSKGLGMTRQRPVEIITPPNVLKAKIGGAMPALDQRAIAKAEAALEKMSGQFAEWIKEELARLLEAWAAFEQNAGSPANCTAAPTTSKASRQPMAIRLLAASAPRCAS
jgi:hypothetical protein